MGISIIDNFDYRAGKPNFTRDLFDDLESMVNFPEMYLPPVFEANIKTTGDRYRYNVNNEIDSLTGKWRLVTPGDGFAEGYTKDEINRLNTEVSRLSKELFSENNTVKYNILHAHNYIINKIFIL